MEPVRANSCFTPEQSGFYDGFLDLSDPFLDLNQALGFSLASSYCAPINDNPTAAFNNAHMTKHDPKSRAQDALDTVSISCLVVDPDVTDNEQLGIHNGHGHEPIWHNLCAVSCSISGELSNGDTKAAHGLDNYIATNAQFKLPHPPDPTPDQHQASVDPHQIPSFLTRPLQPHFRPHFTFQHPWNVQSLNAQPELPHQGPQLIDFDVPSMTMPFHFSSRSSSSMSLSTMDSMQSSSLLSNSVVLVENPLPWSLSAIMGSDFSTPEELLPTWMFNDSFLLENQPTMNFNRNSCLGQISPFAAVSPPGEYFQTMLDPIACNDSRHSRDVISTFMTMVPGLACSDFLSSDHAGSSPLSDNDTARLQSPSQSTSLFTSQYLNGTRQTSIDKVHGDMDWSACAGESFAPSDPCYLRGLRMASDQTAHNDLNDVSAPDQNGFLHGQEGFTKHAVHPGAQAVTGSSFKICHPVGHEAGHISLRPIYQQQSVHRTADSFDRGRRSIPAPRLLHRYYSPPSIMPSPKRRRRLTIHEANFLHTQFKLNERPTAQEREMIAKHLELDRRTIQVWFQNRRAKVKRNAREGFQDMTGTDVELGLELEADRDAESGAWVDVELPPGDVEQSMTFWPDDQGIGGGVETEIRFLGPPYRRFRA